MKFADSCSLPAPPEAVWAALNDPEVLKATLPGCKALVMRDERHFEATVQVRVGPAAATFRGEVELADLEPPRAYTIIGQGNAGPAGFARLTARVKLEGLGDTTLLSYEADVEIGGKLMSVGSRLIQSAAAKNLESFFGAFSAHIEHSVAPAVEQAPVADEVAPGAAPAADPSTRERAPSPVPPIGLGWAPWLVATAAGFAGLLIGFLVGHSI
ncbi:SRPBCC family protein [Paraburkholderia fynbosensis]|uniref:Carbon monoxide dehydrogenase subunit G n=1 Tax=Paraburkholderia fynbosensis TaxID=1200993 RepID=A0A6J5GWR9_9BURK|nr:carbon monoxide dehydrogenase subunit G [Paraburkholderia fynbosensis]CAB3807239.1 hypothetical protein LMG27177_06287 [Paraburkholderia fynbosensis]